MGSFNNKKQLRFVITLAVGKFGSSNNNQITLEGYRSCVNIDKAGWMANGTLRAQIFGMSLSDMNAATTLKFAPDSTMQNQIEVYAIDGSAETLIFSGNMVNAWSNFQSPPDVYFEVQAQSCYFQQLTPVAPRSFNGSFDVASAIGQIVRSMSDSSGTPYVFENNGVNVQLRDMYLAGSAMDQLRAIARAARIDVYGDPPIIAICPMNKGRGATIPELSAETGLIGYPAFDGTGVTLRTEFNPAIVFGGKVRVKSDLMRASGVWVVSAVSHSLSAEMPGGEWFSQIRGVSVDLFGGN